MKSMTNMAKSLLLLAAAAMLILPTGCKDKDTDPNTPENGDVIVLGVAGDLVTTKTPGVITDIKQLTEKMAVYAHTFTKVDGNRVLTWPATPLIGTNVATVTTSDSDPSKLGEIIYYTDKPTPFPEKYTTVYAMFPSEEAAGVKMSYVAGSGPYDDPATVEKGGPKAEVTLKTTSAEQYDILYAVINDLRREDLMNKQKAKIVFNHTLAQLKFRIYGETSLSGPLKLTKVVVNADSKAKLEDMSGDYTSVGTPVDMVMYDGVAIDLPITNTPPEAANVPTGLMLFPSVAMASVKSITLTINGQQYKLDIKTPGFNLEKGNINIVTLKMTPLGLKLAEVATHTISKWLVGSESSDNTSVVNYKTALSLKMQNSKVITDGIYTPAGAMTAEVQINDAYWLEHTNTDMTKTKKIPCNMASGLLSFDQQEPTLMLNDDPVYLTHLRIYEGGTLVFDATAPEGEILIPKTASGALEYGARPGVAMMVNMLFAGFGEGTKEFPYKVQDLDMLKRIKNFTSSSALSINNLHFKQAQTIDLQNAWTPIGTAAAPFYGSYDGGGFALENLTVSAVADGGFFGTVGQATGAAVSEFADITIQNGTVTATTNAGALIGNLLGAASFKNIHNKGVAVTSPCSGGIMGTSTSAGVTNTFDNCSNSGKIASTGANTSSSAAGGIAGSAQAQPTVEFKNCHNTGAITVHNYNGGGILGRLGPKPTNISLFQCSNTANVRAEYLQSSNGNRVGGLIGDIRFNGDAATTLDIQESFNHGAITAKGGAVGGLIGSINSSIGNWVSISIKGCYNTGVTSTELINVTEFSNNNGVGGLVGYCYPTEANAFTVHNCYMAAEAQTPPTSNVRAGYLAGSQRAPLMEVVGTYIDATLPVTGDRDKYNAGTGTIPPTDLKTQAGLDLINAGTPYFKLNTGGFPKLLWEK